MSPPPVTLTRTRALYRTHTVPVVLLAVVGVIGGWAAYMLTLDSPEDLPPALNLLDLGQTWAFVALLGLGVLAAIWPLYVIVIWLTGRTEVGADGVVLRSPFGLVRVPWIDVAALRAVPRGRGHLYQLRCSAPVGTRRQGMRAVGAPVDVGELWIGWHPGDDTAVAAVARPRVGLKYTRDPR